MNPVDYVLLGVVGLIFAFAFRSCVQKFRSGNPCSSCGGGCPACRHKKISS